MYNKKKKSKIVGSNILNKVISEFQCELMDLGDVVYEIGERPFSPECKPEDLEMLCIYLYGKDHEKECVWTAVEMPVVQRLTSKGIEFAEKEFIAPMALKLRREFEALKAEQDANP